MPMWTKRCECGGWMELVSCGAWWVDGTPEPKYRLYRRCAVCGQEDW